MNDENKEQKNDSKEINYLERKKYKKLNQIKRFFVQSVKVAII